jgi:membrane protein DedA with SNARE-associated domain
VILSLPDPFFYWAGRRYGRRLVNFLAANDRAWRRRLAVGERFFARWGAWTIVFNWYLPGSMIFKMAAGEVGMPFWRFVLADMIGSLLYATPMVSLGYIFYRQADSVSGTITHYAGWINWGLLGFIVISAIWRGLRSGPPDDVPPSGNGVSGGAG